MFKKLSALALAAAVMVSPANANPSVDLVQDVQREVNLKLRWLPERDGRDVWVTPLISGRGDCEDYALLKRKMLIDSGWDETDLHLLIVYRTSQATGDREGHVVLYIKSTWGRA